VREHRPTLTTTRSLEDRIMATETVTDASAPPLEHDEYDWGEHFVGTKEQLQAVGIGVGVAFPGEPGAQPRQITVRDPRGFKARIARAYRAQGAGRYRVDIRFPPPERERRRAEREERKRLEKLRAAAQEAGMTVEQWLLRDMPESAAEFRANALGFVVGLLDSVERRMLGRFGYSFDAAARAQCQAFTAGLVQLVEHGRIVFDKAAHEQAVAGTLAAGGIVRQAQSRPTLRVVK
jgi:hypothetical protein